LQGLMRCWCALYVVLWNLLRVALTIDPSAEFVLANAEAQADKVAAILEVREDVTMLLKVLENFHANLLPASEWPLQIFGSHKNMERIQASEIVRRLSDPSSERKVYLEFLGGPSPALFWKVSLVLWWTLVLRFSATVLDAQARTSCLMIVPLTATTGCANGHPFGGSPGSYPPPRLDNPNDTC
jgi:hypothetical protein